MNVVFRNGISEFPLGTRKVIAKEATNWDALAILAKDPNYEVRELVAKNTATRASDLKMLKGDCVAMVREAAKTNLQKKIDQAGMPDELKRHM